MSGLADPLPTRNLLVMCVCSAAIMPTERAIVKQETGRKTGRNRARGREGQRANEKKRQARMLPRLYPCNELVIPCLTEP